MCPFVYDSLALLSALVHFDTTLKVISTLGCVVDGGSALEAAGQPGAGKAWRHPGSTLFFPVSFLNPAVLLYVTSLLL
jgi:hypothetical protein